ncbi:MAG TPA: anhydro-N-acetylmuramic acid kinase [Herpetosiphonaceae bacterium]
MLVIGLISGTSIDAIDAALVAIERVDDALRLDVRAFTMQPFDEALRERVRALLPPQRGTTSEVCEVNVLLGQAFADAANAVAQQAGVALAEVDLIASHGQTVYHQVVPGAVRSTLQLGSPAVIAERTGCTVAADFRPRDMAAGGEGAPLVPYLDHLLFTDDRLHRAVQNIGGIGNVTHLSPNGAELAFDTGPGNVLIDEAVRLLSGAATTFDRDGQMAARGRIDEVLLAAWLAHPFFELPPPKSTGREQWGPGEARAYVAQARERGLSPDDTIATLTALTARSIALAYERYLPQVDEALIGGGGARNPTLMRMLQAVLGSTRVRPVDDLALSADAKEAVAFALLGYAALHGWPNNVPAATGAARPVVLGSITPGDSYRAVLRRVLSAPTTPPRRAYLIEP